MAEDRDPDPIVEQREVVALFDDASRMEHAVEELLTSGFDHSDISLLAQSRVLEDKLNHRLVRSQDLADAPDSPRTTFPDPESRTEASGALASMIGYAGAVTAAGLVFASGGTLAPAIAAGLLVGGTGAAVGAGLGRAIGHRFTDHFQTQIDQGGIIVWVRAGDPAREKQSSDILSRYGAHDIHIHTLPLDEGHDISHLKNG